MEEGSGEKERPAEGFWALFDKLIAGMAALAGALLVFITAAVCYTIGMRFLFTRTSIWIMPISEYALLWIVFLAATWLLREGGHITTDILYTHLDDKAKYRLDLIMDGVGGMTCAALFILGSLHVIECLAGGVTDVRAITVPKAAVFSIIPVGSLFLTLQFFRMGWSRLIALRTMK